MQQIEKGRELFYAVSADVGERPESKPSVVRSRRSSMTRRMRRSASHPSTQLAVMSAMHSAHADHLLASRVHSLSERRRSQQLQPSPPPQQLQQQQQMRQHPQPAQSWNEEEWAADEAAIKKELGI